MGMLYYVVGTSSIRANSSKMMLEVHVQHLLNYIFHRSQDNAKIAQDTCFVHVKEAIPKNCLGRFSEFENGI